MVWIPGGTFRMGDQDGLGRADESPAHTVSVSGFWMDATGVTNREFREFVNAAGYRTTAERVPNWEEMKRELPPDVEKPPEELLVPGSLVFVRPTEEVGTSDPSLWWQWTPGASWQCPEGPGSNLVGREDHPVVHVSHDDAVAYATWAQKRLPTEAEWEFAARGGQMGTSYPWGKGVDSDEAPKANIWQGRFPTMNLARDGYSGTSPVKSFAPNSFGLYDMAGNVWEWCSDWYDSSHYAARAGSSVINPQGSSRSYDPEEPTIRKRVLRGGSFLCHRDYCTGYRVSARMRTAPDTGLSHTGFRCVADAPPPLQGR